MLDAVEGRLGPMQDERRGANAREHVPDVDLAEHLAHREHGPRARPDTLVARPPLPELLIAHAAWRHQVEEDSLAPPRAHDIHHLFLELRRASPRIVVSPDETGEAVDEDEPGHTLGMGRRVQHGHRSATADSVEDRALRPCLVHHGMDVVHPEVERRQLAECDWVGDAASALVERDHPCERAEALEERGQVRLIPLHLDGVPELGGKHHVDRPVSEDLVRDVDFAGLRVASLGLHDESVHRSASPRQVLGLDSIL